MKVGYEVEGRLKGVRTLFLDSKELGSEWEQIALGLKALLMNLNMGLAAVEGIHQIYISDHRNVLNLMCDEFRALYKSGYVVTVERTDLAYMSPPWVNVVLLINAPGFWFLGYTDQVKFEKYQNVCMFSRESGIKTMSWEFANDKEIKL